MKIYITQAENDKYFDQKLPTWRNGFCNITRKVIFIPDPDGIHGENEYGYIKHFDKKIIVIGSACSDGFPKEMEIQ